MQHFKAQDPSYDVVSVDVVWTPEFAAQGWVQLLAGKFAIDTAPLLKVAVDAATYQGKLYAAPMTSDGDAVLPQGSGPQATVHLERG